jgi:hypothetical protein
MRGGREFQSAANHRAMQHGDERNLAELNFLEGAMPQIGMGDALLDVAFFKFAEIETSGARRTTVATGLPIAAKTC